MLCNINIQTARESGAPLMQTDTSGCKVRGPHHWAPTGGQRIALGAAFGDPSAYYS